MHHCLGELDLAKAPCPELGSSCCESLAQPKSANCSLCPSHMEPHFVKECFRSCAGCSHVSEFRSLRAAGTARTAAQSSASDVFRFVRAISRSIFTCHWALQTEPWAPEGSSLPETSVCACKPSTGQGCQAPCAAHVITAQKNRAGS